MVSERKRFVGAFVRTRRLEVKRTKKPQKRTDYTDYTDRLKI
jgi:hypothetical protein